MTRWLRLWLSPSGRVGRGQFWLFCIVAAVGTVAVTGALVAAYAIGKMQQPTYQKLTLVSFGMFWLIVFAWPIFAMCAKRLHDRGISCVAFWVVASMPVLLLSYSNYQGYGDGQSTATYLVACCMIIVMFAPLGGVPISAFLAYRTIAQIPVDPIPNLLFANVVLAAFLAGLWYAIEMLFLPGQVGENRYGSPS